MALNVKRGEIYWADFTKTKSDKERKIRPIIILQNDIGNSKLVTTIVIPGTQRTQTINPVIVQVPKNVCGLKTAGYFLASDIMVIPKSILLDKIGDVTLNIMQEIEMAVKISLGLEDISENPFYKYIT